MARVLVTGGSGFIGSHLVDQLMSAGDDVTVFDAATTTAPDTSNVNFVKGDVRDRDALSRAAVGGVDVIYHLSAVVGVDRYLAVPADVVEINFLGTMNVLRVAQASDAKVVLASTSEIYGKNPMTPWLEDSDRLLGSTAVDRWSYSTSKGLAEHLTFAYMKQYGVRASIVRFFNVYGPRQRPAYVVSRGIHRALRGLAPEVYDGGKQTRCFTYIDDAVEGTILAANSSKADGEHFNIGSNRESTVAEVVEAICEMTGISVPPSPLDTSAEFGGQYQDIERRVPDTNKALEVLGWQCLVPLREGLARTIDWARNNSWWLEQLSDERPNAVPEMSR